MVAAAVDDVRARRAVPRGDRGRSAGVGGAGARAPARIARVRRRVPGGRTPGRSRQRVRASDGGGVGASGAIYGLYGLLASTTIWGFVRRSPVTLPMAAAKTLGPIAAVFVLYSLATDNLHGDGEVVGLVVGFLCGLVLARRVDESAAPVPLVGGLVAATLVTVVVMAVPLRGVSDARPELKRVAAMEDRTASVYDAAVNRFRNGWITAEALARVIDQTIMPELPNITCASERPRQSAAEQQAMVADAEPTSGCATRAGACVRTRCTSGHARAARRRQSGAFVAGGVREDTAGSAGRDRWQMAETVADGRWQMADGRACGTAINLLPSVRHLSSVFRPSSVLCPRPPVLSSSAIPPKHPVLPSPAMRVAVAASVAILFGLTAQSSPEAPRFAGSRLPAAAHQRPRARRSARCADRRGAGLSGARVNEHHGRRERAELRMDRTGGHRVGEETAAHERVRRRGPVLAGPGGRTVRALLQARRSVRLRSLAGAGGLRLGNLADREPVTNRSAVSQADDARELRRDQTDHRCRPDGSPAHDQGDHHRPRNLSGQRRAGGGVRVVELGHQQRHRGMGPGFGVVSIWILGQFNPTPRTTIALPIVVGSESTLGPVVNDAYFGKVPPDRLTVKGSVVLFRADGQYRSKIGLSPSRARSIAGSYDAAAHVLTLVQYSRPANATSYVNSMWESTERTVQGGRRQQLQRRPARTRSAAAGSVLRARNLFAGARVGAGGPSHARPSHVPFRGTGSRARPPRACHVEYRPRRSD